MRLSVQQYSICPVCSFDVDIKWKSQSRSYLHKQKTIFDFLFFCSSLPLSFLAFLLILFFCKPPPQHTLSSLALLIFLSSSLFAVKMTTSCSFRTLPFLCGVHVYLSICILAFSGFLQWSQGLTTHAAKRTFWRVAGNNWRRGCSVQGTLEFS